MSKTTILIEIRTRDKLREIGRKDQTYNEIIEELIQTSKKYDSLDERTFRPESLGGL